MKGSILERIAAAACPTREPLVIEIGSGKGGLTERLLARAERVIAIELDTRLVSYLENKFQGESRLTIISGDALEIDVSQWGKAVIAGNLPYYIATPLIERVVRLDSTDRAIFLIQHEVAERLTSAPGTRDYGYLTVETQLFADARLLFNVKASAFRPPPQVDSAVVHLETQHRAPELHIEDPNRFLEFVGICFHQKRKTIRNNLIGTYGKEAIESWPEAPLRAEQLSLEQFAEMYHRLVTSKGESI